MNEQLEQRVLAAIGGVTSVNLDDPEHPSYQIAMLETQAALKAHAEWLEEQGLVVVPRVDMEAPQIPMERLGDEGRRIRPIINAAHQQEE